MKRILIIPGGLQIGGAERVAADISLYAPAGEFTFHYLIFEGNGNVYGPEIEARGGRVIAVPPPSAGYAAYVRLLKKLIRDNGYSAVHSHTMFNSGINLAVAKLSGVPVRIAHSHTIRKTENSVPIAQKCYEWLMRKVILWSATDLLACGVEAGEWLFGRRAFARKGRVIHNGIDTDRFAFSEENRDRIRTQYGFSADDRVIGHSGTLLPLKNQEFLIRLMPELRRRKPNARLMLLGGGKRTELVRLQELAEECGVSDIVTFCGGVMNANECLSAMDAFAFPSLREGTPLALIEAQVNGLPCAISDRIPKDAILTDLVHPIPLENGDAWLDALSGMRRHAPERYPLEIESSGYSVKTSYQPIYEIYNR